MAKKGIERKRRNLDGSEVEARVRWREDGLVRLEVNGERVDEWNVEGENWLCLVFSDGSMIELAQAGNGVGPLKVVGATSSFKITKYDQDYVLRGPLKWVVEGTFYPIGPKPEPLTKREFQELAAEVPWGSTKEEDDAEED